MKSTSNVEADELAEDDSRASSTEGAEKKDVGGAGKLECADYRPEDCHYNSRSPSQKTHPTQDAPPVSMVTSTMNHCFLSVLRGT